jgi:predicted DNA-binding transcriptional regulator AlpA
MSDAFTPRSSKHEEKSVPSGTYLIQDEVAAVLRLSPRTLERHRLAGTGPAYVKLGRRVLYKQESVEAWAAANTFSSTSAAQGLSN